MNSKILRSNLFIVAVVMVLAAAFSRLLPHPYNFTPLGGMALFAGAVFQRFKFSWLIPFVALWISDLFLNNLVYSQYNDGFAWFSQGGVLLAFVLIFLLGRLGIRQWQPLRIASLSFLGAIVFFLVTNFTSWASATSLYTNDFSGLVACYAAGIPFFGGTVSGDLFYGLLLFGGWYLITKPKTTLVLQIV